MRNALKDKLKSNRGASMILVMALFLVCIMVSSVILHTASSGVSRNAHRAKQQRGYLAVSSASDLIVEELKNSGEYVGKNVKKKYGCENCNIPVNMVYFGTTVSGYRLDADYIPDPLDDGHLMLYILHEDIGEVKETDTEDTKMTGVLGEMFVRAAEHVYLNATSYSEQVQIALSEEDERFPEVKCIFTMDSEYNVKFQLSTEYSEYALIIEAPALVQDAEAMEMDTTSDNHTVYYKDFDSATGAFVDKVDTIFNIPIEVTTIKTKVTWDVPKVEKGVLSE